MPSGRNHIVVVAKAITVSSMVIVIYCHVSVLQYVDRAGEGNTMV